VPATHLVALLDARPNRPFWGRPWVESVLEDHLPALASHAAAGVEGQGEAVRTFGWSVGAVAGGETLVQSRPIVRGADVDPVDDLLRANAACIVAAFSTGTRERTAPRDVVRIARYRRFMAATAGPPLSDTLRRELQAALPDFLARTNGSKSDGELMLMRLLASLHEQGMFGKALAPADALRRGLSALGRMLPQGEGAEPMAIFVSDGRTLGVLHRAGTLLSFEPPEALRPAARFRVDGSAAPSVPASLVLWMAGSGPPVPYVGAERIADGVLSVESSRPGELVRD
jgi:hypothetical protein